MLGLVRNLGEFTDPVADIFSPKKRSWIMSRILQRNTRPEILIRSFLRSKGHKFGTHAKKLPGTPDIVLPQLKTAVFINGCFWHQHPRCSRATVPKTNRPFWVPKLLRNAERDKETKKLLHKQGWSVITLWECQLKNANKKQACLNRLARSLEKR